MTVAEDLRVDVVQRPDGSRGYAGVRHRHLAAMLAATAAEQGDKLAFVDDRGTIGWAALGRAVDACAARLAGCGIAAGDRVALLFPNGIPYVVATWATWRIGAIAVPLNARLQPDEMVPLVQDADVALLLAGAALRGEAVHVAERVGVPVAHEDADGELLVDVDAAPLPALPDDPDAIAAIMYTSGTTGRPKGVVVSHRNFLENSRTCIDAIGRNGDDVELICVPQFNVTGLGSQTIPVVDGGMTGVLVAGFDVPRVLAAIERHAVTSTVLAPTMWWRLLEHEAWDTTDVGSFRLALFGGAPMPTALLERMRDALPGASFGNGYGMTETCSMVTYIGGDEILAHVGSVGRPLPVSELRIVDPTSGDDVADGGEGELWFRGPQVARGYWRNAEATAALFAEDGWLRSGDIGVRGEDGVVVLRDRMKDVIKRGGESIYSFEVENVLHQHPAVLEAAVVGVPDEIYGEQVGAAVACKPGTDVTPDEIVAFCRERLARFKAPRIVVLVDVLPRNAGGKVLKAELRERLVAA